MMTFPCGPSSIPLVRAFFDRASGTVSYLVSDPASRRAAVVDAVLDFDAASARTCTTSADRIAAQVEHDGLQVDWLLETHVHADHLSAARYLQRRLGGRLAIGEHIRRVQAGFKRIYHLEHSFRPDGSQFDRLLADGERFAIGGLQAQALWVPGHTPADLAYRVGDAVFVGDTLFMPDLGTARADFPGGDARQLYRSIRRLLELPAATRVFVCHDYPSSAGREPRWESTVAEQRHDNVHVHDGITEAQFVAMRQARDATLALPALMLPAVQVNVRAGDLPPPEANGVRYLKIPLNTSLR